jgi:hypothetical protein
VELLAIQVLVKVFQGLLNGQHLSTRHTIISLRLEQFFVEVGYKTFAAIWYLGQYTTYPHVAGVGVDDILLPLVAEISVQVPCTGSLSGFGRRSHFLWTIRKLASLQLV